jgi:hypothetical protein
MIVSAETSLPRMLPRKKRNFIAVQRSVPDSSIVSAQPPVEKHFKMRPLYKPLCYDPVHKGESVPLKSLQLNSHADGASLFNAPVLLVDAPLNGVIPVPLVIKHEDMTYELEIAPRRPFDYNSGIRPGFLPGYFEANKSKFIEPIPEPTNPFPTRRGKPVDANVFFGTYKLGKQEINQIGY